MTAKKQKPTSDFLAQFEDAQDLEETKQQFLEAYLGSIEFSESMDEPEKVFLEETVTYLIDSYDWDVEPTLLPFRSSSSTIFLVMMIVWHFYHHDHLFKTQQ